MGAALAMDRASILEGYVLVAPSEAEQALLRQLTQAARDHGKLVRPSFRVGLYLPKWGDEHPLPGATWHTVNPILVLLLAGRTPHETARTFLHELQHVADAPLDITVAQREERAEAFEVLMQRWWR